jgi:hypothetical protein
MKHGIGLIALAFLGWTSPAWASGICLFNCGVACKPIPATDCPDCGCPCDQGHHHCSPRKSERAQQLIGELSSDCCCDRIKAARKLGYRFNADFCCDPQVLDALINAVLCDPCWEVRQAAAWSIALQRARTDSGVLALYFASKADPHYMVRDSATQALGILTVCRQPCFKEVYAYGDQLIKTFKGKAKPGCADCQLLVAAVEHGCGMGCGGPVMPGTTIIHETPALAATVMPAPKGKQ